MTASPPLRIVPFSLKVRKVERSSDLLLANLGLFFICPGVEIINSGKCDM